MYSVPKLPLFIALASAAATTMVSAEITLNLDELVVTGTRSETALLDLAGNTGKLSTTEIDLLNADHISESLLRIPGVNLQRGEGVEMTVALRSPVLTGPGGGGAFLFMEDGIPLRAASFGNNQGLSEVHFEQAGGIEVIRGPGSALYGSNAVHGLFNVLTRDPSETLERKIGITAGSDDMYKLRGSVSDTVGAHAYRISFSGVADHGWRDDSGIDQQKLTVRHDYFAENGDSFQTVFNLFNMNQNTAGFIEGADDDNATADINESLASSQQRLYEDSSLMKENHEDDGYRDWWSVRLSTRWDHELDNGNTLSITPYFRSNEMEFRQHYLPSEAIEENGHDSIGVQTAYYIDFEGGHKVIFGTDFEYTEGHLKQTQQRASYFRFGKARQQGVHYDYDVEAIAISPFVHAEWQLAEKWRATTGLRFDHTSYDYNNNVADGTTQADGSTCYEDFATPADPVACLYQRPADREDTFNDWSPKLGLVYRLAESHSIYSNLSRGHRAPQTTDLYRIQRDQSIGETDSERADNLEIGARGTFEQMGLSYEISAYYMKKKNFFFRDTFGNSVTDAKTKHRGIETSFSLPLGNQFDIAASYSYAIHQYDSSHDARNSPAVLPDKITKGDDIDTAPRHLANVRLGWNFKTDSRAELEWSHIGEYYANPDNTSKYDGHDLLNLRVNTQITRNFAIHGQIKNLLDEKYANRADYRFGTYRFFPGRERHFEVGASYSF